MKHEEKKRKAILKWIKDLKRIPTSRFIGLTGFSYEAIQEVLNNMEKEKIVKKTVETNATYWEIK